MALPAPRHPEGRAALTPLEKSARGVCNGRDCVDVPPASLPGTCCSLTTRHFGTSCVSCGMVYHAVQHCTVVHIGLIASSGKDLSEKSLVVAGSKAACPLFLAKACALLILLQVFYTTAIPVHRVA